MIQGQSNEESIIGEWSTHFSFNDAFEIIETSDQFIGATPLGLILIQKSDFSIHTLTKVNGLSDYYISALSYNENEDIVLIGYENGNIDIIINNDIININDLKIKQLNGSKKINHFLFNNDETYVATDFGILVLNIDKKEISSTYYIGQNASDLIVNQLAQDNKYLYAATESGVRRVLKDAPDRHIYEAWEIISDNQQYYSSINSFADGIIFSQGNKGDTNTLFLYKNEEIQTLFSVNNLYKVVASNNQLIVITNSSLQIFNTSLNLTDNINKPIIEDIEETPSYRSALVSSKNEFWIADNKNGVIKRVDDQKWYKYMPEGPISNHAQHINFSGERLWVIPGGLTSDWNNKGFSAYLSVLSKQGWQHLTSSNNPLLKGAFDLLNISANPENLNNLFVASWGSGIFEIETTDDEPLVTQHFFTPENGLVNIFQNNSLYVRVAATAFDKNNTLWMTNSSVNNAIVAYLPKENKWFRFSYGALNNNMGMAPILAASNGDMWLSVFRGEAKGLFIWNDNNTPDNESDDIYRSSISKYSDSDSRNQGQILLWNDEGAEITRNIYSMAEDKNGDIWLGTDQGIVVQYQPSSIFTKEKPTFSQIKIARQDGSSLADYLLGGQTVTSILVDPGNRKWLGTDGNGIYLVSSDGYTQLEYFNTDNSPLPSNYINSIAINENTGEIYIATGEGIVSYKGSATKGSTDYSNIYAFPNPVRPNFRGNITITGLITQTTVKITDSTGNLVYETTSVGGQAFWDGTNFWGEKVKSGVYIVFVAEEDGSQSAATKIAIIR